LIPAPGTEQPSERLVVDGAISMRRLAWLLAEQAEASRVQARLRSRHRLIPGHHARPFTIERLMVRAPLSL
jgi:hypothetical protein